MAIVHPTDHFIMGIEGASRFLFHGDVQHTMHLGVDAWLSGAILADLVLNGGWAGTRDERASLLWGLAQTEYKKLTGATKLATFRWRMFWKGDGSFPCLRAHAMEVHHVLLSLPAIMRSLHDGSAYHDIRLKACESLVRLHSVFADAGIFVSDSEAARAVELADDFLICNNYLLREAMRRRQLLYNHVSKTHLTWHIAYMARWQNPKLTACFDFEDFMGYIKTCAQASVAGSPLTLIGSKVLEHFLLSLHLRLTDLI